MYRALTDRKTDGQTCPFCKRIFRTGVFCAGGHCGEGRCARFDRVPAVLCQSEYLCRVSGVSGEAAFVVPGVRDHARPAVPPRFGRADAFRFTESGVAA